MADRNLINLLSNKKREQVANYISQQSMLIIEAQSAARRGHAETGQIDEVFASLNADCLADIFCLGMELGMEVARGNV